MIPPDTLPRLLRRNAAGMGGQPAMREKRHGIWQTLTWAEYDALVRRLALGLAAHGFAPGDRLAVMGDNRTRLYAALLAAQSRGGVGMALWPDAEPEAVAAELRQARVRVAVAEDREQLGKLLAVKAQLPALELIVSLDPRAARQHAAPWLTEFAALEKAGEAADGTGTDAALGDGRPDDPALLLCRTGGPGVLLTHGNLIAAARAIAAAETVRPEDETLCWLPMAWIGDALYTFTLGLFVGFTCNCPENPETARRDLREIGPSFLAAPPAAWDGFLADIEDRATNNTHLKRAAFAAARAVAEPAELRRTAGEPSTFGQRLGLAAAERLVFGPMRDRVGLARVRWAHTGGTPLAPDLWRRVRMLGINLKQSYGPAELAGIATVQPDNPVAPDTLGLPAPGVELRVAPDGEVLARGDTVCRGYDNLGAADTALGADGWWHTGDAGELDQRGRLIVLDRMAHLGTLADGSRFVPRTVEGRLRHSRLIDDALVFGDGRPFVGAIIAPSRIGIAEWAAREGMPGVPLAELVALPALRAAIREEIRACNAVLPTAAQVRRFVLLDRPIDTPDIESRLDRARLRRLATARLAEQIERLFLDPAGDTEVPDAGGRVTRADLTVEEVDTTVPQREPAHA